MLMFSISFPLGSDVHFTESCAGFLWQNSDGFISRKLEELLNLMIEVMPSCHFSAKRHRLNCLYFLSVHVYKVRHYTGLFI